jgi:DNA invertase Pin-like site-specific DNA recombinase
MLNSGIIQEHHLARRAVIYIRQSTGHQVLSNVESRKMQIAMTEHARRLGWADDKIEVVEADTGRSAQSTAGRDGYKRLLSEVVLGEVGIIVSYESARLSRNCSDWYPLLDVCSCSHSLIADRDGTYDPSTANGRLLLGMKGILSEIELHTLRGRLIAGVQNKARRGDLALRLPAGLVRLEDGRVIKDPNLQIQGAINLIFRTFLELKSAAKVVRHFNQHGVRIPKHPPSQDIVWRQASIAGIVCALRNPAYAGAFVYGRTQLVRKPGKNFPSQRRRDINDWSVIVKDRYDAYISWETFEQIQKILSDNYAEYDRNKSRGVPRNGEALLQGLAHCGECGHKMVVQYKKSTRYLCNYHRQKNQEPVCQYLPANPIDRYVVNAFFEALSPAELNLYEKALETRHSQRANVDAAQERELQRLRYEVELARRQYDRVDPDNRLVASELERRWEAALRDLRKAEEQIEQLRRDRDKVVPLRVPGEIRQAFESLGTSLPGVWSNDSLTRAQRKALLRCLIDKVVMSRKAERDLVHVRIVWRGGAWSECDIAIPVGSISELSRCSEMEALILELNDDGKDDDEIAATLTARGFRSPSSEVVLRSTVVQVRYRHGRMRREVSAPRRPEGQLTLPEAADRLGVKSTKLQHLVRRGVLELERSPTGPSRRPYLVPDQPEVLEQLRKLCGGIIPALSTKKGGHQDE